MALYAADPLQVMRCLQDGNIAKPGLIHKSQLAYSFQGQTRPTEREKVRRIQNRDQDTV